MSSVSRGTAVSVTYTNSGGASTGPRKRGVTAWHYGGGLAYELTDTDVRPLLLVGAGGVTWDGASETDLVFRFGAALKVLFGKMAPVSTSSTISWSIISSPAATSTTST